MKISTIYFLTLFFLSLHSNAQVLSWAYSENYTEYSHLLAFKKDQTGDFYFATFDDSIGNSLTSRLDKRDATQNLLWRISLNPGAIISDVEINSQNHAVVMGYFQDTLTVGSHSLVSQFHNSAFIFETEANGNVTWAVKFNPINEEFRPVDLFVDKNDEIYLTAENSINDFCSFHKLDVWGNPIQSEFPGNTEVRTFSHILVDDLGNVYISGTCGNFATFDSLQVNIQDSYQNMLVKYDASFNAQWLISRPYITFDHNNGLGSDGSSLYWAFNEMLSSTDTIKIVKVDYNGQFQNEVAGPLSLAFFPYLTMSTDSSGNSLLAVNIWQRLYLFRFDDQLNQTWQDSIYTHYSAFPPDIRLITEDSAFYVGSRYYGDSLYIDNQLLLNPHPGPEYDIFIARWSDAVPTAVSSITNESINVYPNPAKDLIKIDFPLNTPVTIRISDLTGKVFITQNISGNENNQVNLSSLAPGYYTLSIFYKDQSAAVHKKIVVHL